jgi:hypothetical protein
MEDLTWLLFAAMKDGAPVFYRFPVAGQAFHHGVCG